MKTIHDSQAVELLAPARDFETGQAAINSGADAVYIGAAQFGARQAAANSLKDIEALVNYAHIYHARVYVTVNTLLYDEEITAAVVLIQQLYNLGADAVIIQDMGLLECDLPPIPLFASTQMHNHTPERVAFLETVGIQRVILARELSLDEIKAIRAVTRLELESFIHGALCVSYSGQCYASYAIGGRSGNRGQCAQPCRKKYSLVDAEGRALVKDRYLLSLKDLNLSHYLDDLLAAGVRSFKIEGRLKDKGYVGNVVYHYRRRLDAIFEQGIYHAASSGKVQATFKPDPLKTFNRGYTTYFLTGRQADMSSMDTPKSLGEPLGKVSTVQRQSFTLDSSVEVHNADGLCFFDSQQELIGTTVNQVNGKNITPAKMDGIRVGLTIYRNHDHHFSALLDRQPPERKIGLSFVLEFNDNKLTLQTRDEDDFQVSENVQVELNTVLKADQFENTLRKQLGKLGDTPFICRDLHIAADAFYFLPLSEINRLRRSAVDKLLALRLQAHTRSEQPIIPNDAPFPQEELDFNANVLNQKAAAFYKRHGVKKISPAAESGLDLHGKRIMTTRYCIKYQLGMCPRLPDAPKVSGNLALRDEEGELFSLHFNCAECHMEVYFSE